MKVYLSFDIEGVSGIADRSDIDPASPDFPSARAMSAHDVNAAVEGAIQAGATEIVINDGHGWHRKNIRFEDIHPAATLLKARVSTDGLNMAQLDDSYDAVFFVGWHARPSAPGILSHCLNSRVFTEWRVNGTPVGEPELAAAYAGYFGVPVVLFTGDDQSCKEVERWAPACERVVTKTAIDRYSAICLSKEVTHELIRDGAERALRRKAEIPPFQFEGPVRVEADTLFDHTARTLALVPGVEQTGLLTVSVTGSDYKELYRTIHAVQLLSGIAE